MKRLEEKTILNILKTIIIALIFFVLYMLFHEDFLGVNNIVVFMIILNFIGLCQRFYRDSKEIKKLLYILLAVGGFAFVYLCLDVRVII